MSVLITVHLAGRSLRVGEIAARMEVVGPHVTRLVNNLEKRGLVNRVADPFDQRSRLVELTAEGASATERYLRFIIGWLPASSPTGPSRTAKIWAGSSDVSPTTSPSTWRPSRTSRAEPKGRATAARRKGGPVPVPAGG